MRRWIEDGATDRGGGTRTLNAYMDVILRLLGFTCVFVGFGEGVCEKGKSAR